MNKLKRKLNEQKFFIWLVFQSFVIIIAAVLSYTLVEIVANFNNLNEIIMRSIFLHSIGVILPMAIFLGFLNYLLTKLTHKYVTTLALAIEKVANGNFNIQLNTENAGPFTDVYENFNKMCRELNSIQTLRNDFINNFSHEFKTPLTSIKGFAELLQKSNISEEEKKQFLKIIIDETSRLVKMANDSILFTKLNTQSIIYNKKPFSLDEQIRQCAILLSPQWTSKNINLNLNLEHVIFNGNKDLMKHVWINLIDNAIKYTPTGGRITINLNKSNNGIIFVISDTGEGIKKEIIQHIFEPYFQNKTENSINGLGLGLSVVKRIIELCNGEIQIDSSEELGTTFRIWLPK